MLRSVPKDSEDHGKGHAGAGERQKVLVCGMSGIRVKDGSSY
ncbi:hypothetical protein STTU_5026 [Streptomyces sp. Tu6071]|nr:hypothetical protein STTU_5026 [Streptomyces sp. Tu6071]